MSEQTDLQTQISPAADTVSGAEDIVGALSGGETGIITEERKPLNRSTIVTFVVLVLGVGAVWYMYQRAGGPKAVAAKETVEAKKTINIFLSGGESNIKVMETMLRNTQKVVQQFLNYPTMTQVPLQDLNVNPFRIRPATSGVNDGSLDSNRERQAALRAIERLQLQSIMYSETRKGCMINGHLYVEGQQVENFIIEQINPASVVVKAGVYRFELKLQR